MTGAVQEGQRAWIAAGRALARVLLRATVDGLSVSYLNQPIEVTELRPLIAQALGQAGYPQLLVRFGKAPPARPTPRRSLDEVLRR